MMWDALTDRERGFRLFTPEVLEKMRACRVLLVGCGGNGAVLDLLARAGFARFGLIDGDEVDATNLNRLPFYRDAVGLPKTEAWQRHVQAINPDARVQGWRRSLNRHDGLWLEALLRGQGWEDGDDPVSLVFLGTTDVEANLVVGRTCARTRTRMLIGPASSGSWVVGTFLHREGDVDMETLAGFGTRNTPLEDIDYAALRPRYLKALDYPGRAGKLLPGVGRAVVTGELPARSCGIFVRMTNAAMAFEAIKNVADMHGLPVDGTAIVSLPRVQIFDPYSGCAYYYDIQRQAVGVPGWPDGDIRWTPCQAQ